MAYKKKMIGILIGMMLLSTMTGCSTMTASHASAQSVLEIDRAYEEVDHMVAQAEVIEDREGEETPSYQKGKVESIIVVQEDFEAEGHVALPRGDVQLTRVVADDGASIQVSERQGTWQGVTFDVTDYVQPGDTIEVTARLKYDEGEAIETLNCSYEKNGSEYFNVGSVQLAKGEWATLTCRFEVPQGTETISIYFESPWQAEVVPEALITFCVDDVVIEKIVIEEAVGVLPQLKTIYEESYTVGIGVVPNDLSSDKASKIICEQFNSLTAGNEMKPDAILDYATCLKDPIYDLAPALDFTKANILLDFAKENQIGVRGHTLVWHQQTPTWFFKEGYSMAEDAAWASREVMLSRMESYIAQVINYVQTAYPGVVYAWDVVNEAIEVSDGHPRGIRMTDNPWYETIGEDYVEWAFTFARNYADEEVKLFYNDYNTYIPNRRLAMCNLIKDLKEKKLLDGMGMQSHIQLSNPGTLDYREALLHYAALDVEIHITELDVFLEDGEDETLNKQATRYKSIFGMAKDLNEKGLARITNITLWGLTDDTSWLNKDGNAYPLLFDQYFEPKEAFWRLVE